MTNQARPDLLPLETMREVNLALSEMLGCLVPEDRLAQLSRALERAAARLGLSGAAHLCRIIAERQLENSVLEELAAELLPGETYFFRDSPSLQALQQELLPRLLQERSGEKRLNLWSAGCSTGEEPLTLAILLRASLAEMDGWKIRILATDLRARALATARQGCYRDWSFRDCPEWIRTRHFERQASGAWAVAPDILAMVEYRQFNLVGDSFPPPDFPAGGFDLILCRNVLIYLDPCRIPLLINRLGECLAQGGLLLVAAAEAPSVSLDRYECVHWGKALFFRKRNATPKACENAVPTSVPLHAEPAAPSSGSSPRQIDRTEQAEKKATELGKQRAGNSDAALYQAQAERCLERGDLTMARELLRKALYLDRHNAMGLWLQGKLSLAEGQPTRAHRAWLAALKLAEQLPPSQQLDHERQLTALELAAMLREELNRINR
jgi:chemotaxis protein methyltransferase CheR